MDRQQKTARRRFSVVPGTARSVELFLDTSGLAGQGAQVVQLGLAHGTTALDSDAVNHRGIGLEGTLDAYTAGDLAHGESRVQTTVTLTDNHAFEGLQTLTIAFFHFYLDDEIGSASC